MAVVQISRIQVRRGLSQDLPQLSSGEFGWAIDERKLYIGNGTTAEGAPQIGNTEILTQFSDVLALFDSYSFKGLEGGFEVLTGDSFLDRINRTLINKLDDFVNVRDFGAVGRGAADDTDAVVRALKNLYNNTNYGAAPEQHRTIHFPAGKYRISGQVLKILPWTRITGEGKACTEIIQIDSTQPTVIRLVDNFNQFNSAFGDQQGTNPALIDQYQIEDIAIVNTSSSTSAAMIVDGGEDAVFNRVRFDCGAIDLASVTSTAGHATVSFTGNSTTQKTRNFKFHQCDFVNSAHGTEINNDVTKISFISCKFDQLYQGITAGNNSTAANKPSSITVLDCEFDNIKNEAIYGHLGVEHITSKSNTYGTNIGRGGDSSAAPVTPVIVFTADNNFSIADRYSRTEAESSVLKPLETNGYNCYAVLPSKGTVNGRTNTLPGTQTTLLPDQVNVSTGLTTTKSAIVHYTLERDDISRQGTMKISIRNGNVFFDDEYSETGIINVEFTWELESDTAVLKYSSNSGSNTTFFYSLKFFE